MIAVEHETPSVLVSYLVVDKFRQRHDATCHRDWALDSGAFAVANSGQTVDLEQYIRDCHALMAADDPPQDIFGLDVIGNWRESLANYERMWAAGVPMIPTYHVGEPEHVLLTLARTYPKIALGGAVLYPKKIPWAQQCFARVWPKRIHGLGFGGWPSLRALPWHSVDATNWRLTPHAFGKWRSFDNRRIHLRDASVSLRMEVEHWLRDEQRARILWAREMKELSEPLGVRLRLVVSGDEIEIPALKPQVPPCTDSSPSWAATRADSNTPRRSSRTRIGSGSRSRSAGSDS